MRLGLGRRLCCRKPKTQVCSTLILPFGFDVIVPDFTGCTEIEDYCIPGSVNPNHCACSQLPGTHKVFRADYVARKHNDGCALVLPSETPCRFRSVSGNTTTAKVGPLSGGCNSEETRLVYTPTVSVTAFCRHFDEENECHLTEAECLDEENIWEDHAGRLHMIEVFVGSLADPSARRIGASISSFARLCGGTNVSVRFSTAFGTGEFPVGTNIAEMESITLTANFPEDRPQSITLIPNNMGLPT